MGLRSNSISCGATCRHYEDCADYNVIKDFQESRIKKLNSCAKMLMQKRFPNINNGAIAFQGPGQANISYASQEVQEHKEDFERDSSQVSAYPGFPLKEQLKSISVKRKLYMKKPTVASTVKGRVLLDQIDNNELSYSPNRFIPNNPREAKDSISRKPGG
jgi:hypothetical protein